MPPRSAEHALLRFRMPRLKLRNLGIVAAAFVALTTASEASAYCRTSVCNGSASEVCNPAGATDCGTPLFWAKPCLSFSVQEDASVQLDLATAESLMDQAFAAWENADCGGALPSLFVDDLGSVACDQVEYNQDAGNANVVVFRDVDWPYDTAQNALALTTVTFNKDTAEIVDADLEVNSTGSLVLTTGDVDVQYDVLSIFTHEAGHMLGIAHTDITEATMTVEYVPGETGLRTLHPDDMAAICDAFPPGTDLSTCNSEPRRGLASQCGGAPVDDDGCSCSAVGRGGDGRRTPHGWLVLAGAACIALRRRRTT
jgi:MYXO-CTERM domain-containing protein